MTSWRDFLAQVSIVLGRVPPKMLAFYAAVIGLVMASFVVGQARLIAGEKGDLYGGLFIAGVAVLMGITGWKALRKGR